MLTLLGMLSAVLNFGISSDYLSTTLKSRLLPLGVSVANSITPM